jgi:hypothetical protein
MAAAIPSRRTVPYMHLYSRGSLAKHARIAFVTKSHWPSFLETMTNVTIADLANLAGLVPCDVGPAT